MEMGGILGEAQSHPAFWFLLLLFPAGMLLGLGAIVFRALWRDLPEFVARHQVAERPQGRRFYFAPGSIGYEGMPFAYQGYFVATVNDQGFHLRLLMPLWIRCSSLWFSWEDVRSIRVIRPFLLTQILLTIGDRSFLIYIMGSAATQILKNFEKHYPERILWSHL